MKKASLRDEWEDSAGRLKWLEKLAAMTVAQRAKRMREIETPSQRLAAATARVDETQAADRARFEKLRETEGDRLSGDLHDITLEKK